MSEVIRIVVPLAPITKKNSGRIVGMGRRCPVCKVAPKHILLPSKEYSEYERKAKPFLEPLKYHIDYPVNIKCLFYMPTRRTVDLTNLLSAVDDVLVKWGVLEDDNFKIVAGHDGSRVLHSREFPRTEIVITRMEE